MAIHLSVRLTVLVAALILVVAPAAAPAKERGRSAETLISGAELPGANGLELLGRNRLVVASTGASRISVIDRRSGALLGRFGPEDGVVYPEDVAIGPDGAIYWTGFLTGAVGRIPADGDAEIIANVGPGANPIAFDRDGRLFVGRCVFGDGVYEVDPDGVDPVRTVAEGIGAGCGLNGMDFGPDGRLYGPQPTLGRIVALDVDTGDLDVIATGLSQTLFAVDVAADGTIFAVDGPVLRRVDPDSGQSEPVTALSFLPDNLVVDDRDGRIFVSSVSTAEVVEVSTDGSVRTVSAGGLALPQGVALDSDRKPGGLLVATAAGVGRYSTSGAPTGFIPAALPNAVTSLSTGPQALSAGPFGGLVTTFDVPAGRSAFTVGGLEFPIDAARFGDDILVTEGRTGRVLRVSATDPSMREAVLSGAGSPAGLAVRGGDAWVSDIARGRVLQLADRGRILARPRLVAGGLDRPLAILARPGGLIVVESGAGRLTKLSSGGRRTTLTRALTPANPPLPGLPTDGSFAGVASANRRGALYVSDPLTNRVLRVATDRRQSGRSATR